MNLAASIISDYLHKLRNQFYEDDKRFYQQRGLLIKGITHLAVWLDMRGAKLPDRRYRAILDEIITGIQHHGNTRQIGYFCRYWLKTVQEHVKHHGDHYYDEAKDFRNALDRLTGDLTSRQAKKVEEAKEDTTEQLASMARLLKSGPRPGKKRSQESQPTLF